MPYQERECLQCGNQFEGRSNRKFCASTCRAQFHRDNVGVDDNDYEEIVDEEPNEPVHGKVNLLESSPSLINRFEQADEEERRKQFHALEAIRLRQLRIEAQLRHEAAEEAQEKAEKIESLHGLYSTLIKKCLKIDQQELDEDELETWVDELDEASEKYMLHPGLLEPENKAHKRLKDLYWLRDMFSDLLEESNEEGEPVLLELSPKRKARFRANRIS